MRPKGSFSFVGVDLQALLSDLAQAGVDVNSQELVVSRKWLSNVGVDVEKYQVVKVPTIRGKKTQTIDIPKVKPVESNPPEEEEEEEEEYKLEFSLSS